MQKVITQCEPGINNIKKWNVFSWYCIWLPNAQSFISRWWFWWNSLNSFVFRCYLRRSFNEDKSSFAAAVAYLHPVKYLRPYYRWQICKMLKTSTVSNRHQLVSASHSVFSGWTNTGGHENSALKRIKSKPKSSVPQFHSVFPTSCHPISILSLLSRTRGSETQEMGRRRRREPRGERISLCLFWFVYVLFAFARCVSVRFPSAWPFAAFPIDRFPPPDSGRLCLCLCRPFASSVPSSLADSYLRVSTLLFVYRACGFTPTLLIIPRTTENTSTWVMSQSLFFFFFLPSNSPSPLSSARYSHCL